MHIIFVFIFSSNGVVLLSVNCPFLKKLNLPPFFSPMLVGKSVKNSYLQISKNQLLISRRFNISKRQLRLLKRCGVKLNRSRFIVPKLFYHTCPKNQEPDINKKWTVALHLQICDSPVFVILLNMPLKRNPCSRCRKFFPNSDKRHRFRLFQRPQERQPLCRRECLKEPLCCVPVLF